jgi:DNA replication and repair protein RecF
MIIKKLKVINFRNYKEESIQFSPGLNVLTGKNASGKTNLLEAVYLGAIGKSPRTQQDKEMINWGEEYLYAGIELQGKYRAHKVEIHIDNHSAKRIAIDGLPIKKLGEIMGVLNVVYFSPDELKMIKESPRERRRFMDISLSQQKKKYFYNLQRYNKALDQRNKLLKTARTIEGLKDMLAVWDIQLAAVGAEIISDRLIFLEKLSVHAAREHDRLSSGREELLLRYESDAIEETSDIKKQLMLRYESDIEKDYALRYTSSGPHRDDIKITLNGTDVRKFGSQGQQRSAALSIKMAEISQFEEETGEKPILLLDDVLSELDEGRRVELLNAASGVQTILTCTEFDIDINPRPALFTISQGAIINRP